ncbi:MAG: hypothetical protein AB1700_11505 [Bacillota bacterium]
MKLVRSNRYSTLEYPIWAQPVLRAKRWVALIGIASLCLTTPSMFFWDRILAGLPITSANFLVYRLSQALAGNRPPERIEQMLESWVKNNPEGFGVVVADDKNRVVLSTVRDLLGKQIEVNNIDDRKEVGSWLVDHARDQRYQDTRECHVAYEIVNDRNGNVRARVWAINRKLKYLSWHYALLLVLSIPDVRMGLWMSLFWLSIPIWIYLDALVYYGGKSREAWLWSMAGMALNVVGLAVYFLARQRTLQRDGLPLTSRERR